MLYDPDVRAMIRLLGELSGSDEALAVKRQILLTRLCELIDGDRWSWSLTQRAGKNRMPVCLEKLTGGRAPAPASAENPPAPDGKYARRQLTVRQIEADVVSSISLVRDAGRAAFTAQETKMAQIILSEIPWLHERNPDAELAREGKGLTPRERATLVHWVNGLSSRAIAEKLGISPYTVQDYIKSIYQHYRVNCRPELLQKIALGWER